MRTSRFNTAAVRAQALGCKTSGRKADLIVRLAEAQSASGSHSGQKEEPPPVQQAPEHTGKKSPVILILDDDLQRIPIEMIPCLRTNSCVSRMPSLQHLLHRVRFVRTVVNNVRGPQSLLWLAFLGAPNEVP